VTALRPSQQPDAAPTLLVVEDSEDIRELLVEILRGEGYRVLIAEDGEQAVEHFTRVGGRVDLLISDVSLPGLSGPEVALRLHEERPEMPLVLISGHHDAKEVCEMFLAPASFEFLEKPFSPEDLLLHVRMILRGRDDE
jgi:DNA-binding NtrC family response regulator